jgi:hypothetical protein
MENTYFNRLTLTGLNEKNRKNGNAPGLRFVTLANQENQKYGFQVPPISSVAIHI